MATQLNTSVWYHDAAADAAAAPIATANHEAPIISNTLSPDRGVTGDEAHLYGVCMDCGIGLDDPSDFFYDRREKQCDCFTCNKCFEHFFGKDELFKSANWKTLGIQAPQYIRM
jgi:hypothetical protein